MRKNLPYILLVLLMFIAFFFVGMRYGQKVERVNKTITYILTNTPPTPTALPKIELTETPVAPLTFKTYDHAGCGVSFVYPSLFTKLNESSDEASFGEDGETVSLTCEKRTIGTPTPTLGEQVVLPFQDKQVFSQKLSKNESMFYRFQVIQPRSGSNVTFTIKTDIYPLIERSIRFFQPK